MIDLPQLRGWPVSVRCSLLLGVALVASMGVLLSTAAGATAAGVSGEIEALEFESGSEPGELSDPREFGVDPVDGSIYVVSHPPESTAAHIDKFSASGTLEGTVPISLAPEAAGAEYKNLVGIAVDHSRNRFYLVQDEWGIDTVSGIGAVATKVLAYSTELSSRGKLGPPVASFNLPAPNGSQTILWPGEIHVDPKTGDVVISGTSRSGHAILQRVSATGTLGARYEETGSHLVVGELGEEYFGFDLGPDGTTYLVTNSNPTSEPASIEGFSLPPKFTSSSPLTALPGFVADATESGWQSNPASLLITPNVLYGETFGPQLALVTKAGGEEVLYWQAGNRDGSRQPVFIHGYSLGQRTTVAGFGGGPLTEAGGECSIQYYSSLAATTNGDLAVLARGQEVSSASQTPAWPSVIYRFGPGGTGCPDPAPALGLESPTGGAATSVPSGTRVILDASASEPGKSTEMSGTPNALEGLTWYVKRPNGTEENFPINGTPPAEKLAHTFTEAGKYTVRVVLKVRVGGLGARLGTRFAAEARELTVTPNSGVAPTVTSVSPATGPGGGGNSVVIEGTGLEGATGVQFGLADATITEATATKVVATAPPGPAGESVDVFVSTAGGTSAAGAGDKYQYIGAPTVTSISPTTGPAAGGTVVTINGTGLGTATEVRFGALAATNLTPVSSTQLQATSPAGSGAVHVVVVAAGGPSSAGSADTFTYEAPPTRSLTIAKVGSGSVSCNGAACQTAYPVGSSVVLHATPDPGSTFVGWSGGGCAGTGDCTVVLTTNTSLTATFGTPPPASSSNPPAGGSGGAKPSSPPPPPPPGGGKKPKTPAEILKEKQQKALQKCKKLHGKAKAKCIKKAKQIGKPKKAPKKAKGGKKK